MAVTLRELLVRIDTDTTALRKGLLQSEKDMKRFSNTASVLSRSLLGVFAIDRVARYGKEIVKTTAEFEKLETVLSSTLGSSSLAQKSFELIAKFAAKTPFSVEEVTQSFVKLANRGVVPAYSQLERMADVASVLGKPFQQLVEAILDVSNSKRWTELGIKAENAGDKVRLTFRGVTKEVERTEAGVLGAIESFGQMQGVFGVTAKVAETTAGKLGELGDNMLFLQKNIGDSQGGLIHGFLNLANQALGDVNKSLSDTNKLIKDLDLAKLEKMGTSATEKGLLYLFTGGFAPELIKAQTKVAEAALEGVRDEVQKTFSEINKNGELLAAPGDSIAQLEIKLAELNKRLEERQFYKYAEFLKKEAEPAIADITKRITDQTKALNDKAEAEKLAAEEQKKAYQEQMKVALALSKIEMDARKSESMEDFIMPDLSKREAFKGLSALTSDIIEKPYQQKMLEDIERANNALDDQEAKRKKTAEDFERIGNATQFWGGTMTDIFASMITDGANAVEILTDAIKKMVARLTAAAIAAGLVSAFLGGGSSAVLKSLGGFKGLFSSFAGIPAFADGGLVSGPTMGLIGEGPMTSKSNPEVIAPLNDLKNIIGFGGGQLVARVSGNDLLFILDRAQRDYGRL